MPSNLDQNRSIGGTFCLNYLDSFSNNQYKVKRKGLSFHLLIPTCYQPVLTPDTISFPASSCPGWVKQRRCASPRCFLVSEIVKTIHQPGMVCHSNLCLLSCCLDLNCTVPAVCLYKHVPDHSSSLWNIFYCMYLTGCKPSCLCLYKAKPHYHRLLAQLWKNIEDLLVAPSSLWNQYNLVFRNSIYAQPHSKQINSSQ